jgi:dolichol-phosphate mannosyltransferase
VGIDAHDRLAFDHERGASDWLGACTVDQRAATNRGCHPATPPGSVGTRFASFVKFEGYAQIDAANDGLHKAWRQAWDARLIAYAQTTGEFVAAVQLTRSLVVLPTYNERENIQPVLSAILGQSADIDVLVVDDNSPDGTGQIVERLSEAEPRIHVMHRAEKRGLGTAYIEGFLWALARDYAYILEMDADFSHDPADLLRLRAVVINGDADASVGSRWVPGGGTRNWSFLRTFISRGGSVYARLILGIPVRDLTSGFKCFSRRVLEHLDLQSVHSNGYAFQVEMNYRCFLHGFRVAEVPIVFVDRRVGKSKMGSHIVTEAMLVVLRLRLQRLFGGRKPQSSRGSGPAPAKYSRTP